MFELHLLAENGVNGLLHLGTVLNVHRPDVRLTNVHLGIRMLRGQLQRGDIIYTPQGKLGTACVFPGLEGNRVMLKPPPLTSLNVGLPLKKSVFLLLFGGLNLGLRKAQPLAMASSGAGPS